MLPASLRAGTITLTRGSGSRSPVEASALRRATMKLVSARCRSGQSFAR